MLSVLSFGNWQNGRVSESTARPAGGAGFGNRETDRSGSVGTATMPTRRPDRGERSERSGPVVRRPPGWSQGARKNARLTAGTGLLLTVLLFAEGVTVAFIGPLFSWHILIGLILIPPVALKTVSTLWRFARFYLGDRRYRKAGPPPPLLRLIGPFITVSTALLFLTGIMVWLEGPSAVPTWGFAHKVIFVGWFGLMTIHVLGHILQAVRLVRSDVRPRRKSEQVAGAWLRQGLVLASLLAGVLLGLAARGASSSWTLWAIHHH